MNIAELFVSLGVKGSEKTVGALTNVRKGMKDITSTSLEAKVAIVGVMYAMERLFAASGQTGTGLTNFNALMGGNFTQTLQRYQYAARQAGVTNEATEATFKSLSATMTKTLMGEGAPTGLARVSDVLKRNFSREDIKEWSERPQLLIDTLQEYAAAEKNAGLKRETLSSFGASEAFQPALDRQVFNAKNFAAAPTYGDKEVGALDRANIAWSNLGTTIEMAVGHFNAKHGEQIVGEITTIVKSVLQLAEAFQTFAEKADAWKKIDLIFKGWKAIFEGLIGVVDAVNAIENPDQAKAAAKFKKDHPQIAETVDLFLGGDEGRDAMTPKPYTPAEMGERQYDAAHTGPLRALFIEALQAVLGTPPPPVGAPVPESAVKPYAFDKNVTRPLPDVEIDWGDKKKEKKFKYSKYKNGRPGSSLAPPTPGFIAPRAPLMPPIQGIIAPSAPPPTAGSALTNNLQTSVTVNVGEGAAPKEIADKTAKAIKDAYFSLPALVGGP